MKKKMTPADDTPIGQAESEAGHELDDDQVDRALRAAADRQETALLKKEGLQIAPILYWRSTAEIPRESKQIASVQHTKYCLCDQCLPIAKYVLPGDVIATRRGDRDLTRYRFELLTEEEVDESYADAGAQHTGAEIRRLDAPRLKAESDLLRARSELSNRREVARSILDGCEQLEIEIAEKEAAVKRASRPLEDFLRDKLEAWKTKALTEAARTDRESLPAEPPEKARAFFPPRLEGEGKEYVWNALTGQRERIR